MKSNRHLPSADSIPQAVQLTGLLDELARRCMLRPVRTADSDDIPLSRQEIRVLISLGDRPSQTMGELARGLVVSVSRLSALVDRLAGKGLVDRRRCEQDRRVVRVGLTPRGRRQRDRGRSARLGMAGGMLSALVASERECFLFLMRKIVADAGSKALPAGRRIGR